jgi:hypothetical protein
MDKIVSTVVGLGVPGLVLLAAVSMSGLAGGAAIVAGLAALGGPLGMMGGLGLLGLMVLISRAITKYGYRQIVIRVVDGLHAKGLSDEEIIKMVDNYPAFLVPQDLKLYIKDALKA